MLQLRFFGAPGMGYSLVVKVLDPLGSGQDTAKAKGVTVRWGLKEDGVKTPARRTGIS